MVYKFKIPELYSISAQQAGEELDRIYRAHGELTPSDIVNESRAESAPLHPCFEWRDAVAAEKYRENQARKLVCSVIVVRENAEPETKVRAFQHVESAYYPTEVILKDADKYQSLLLDAIQYFKTGRQKYETLTNEEALHAIFDAIDSMPA